MLDYWRNTDETLSLSMDEVGFFCFHEDEYNARKYIVTKEDLEQLIKSIQVMI